MGCVFFQKEHDASGNITFYQQINTCHDLFLATHDRANLLKFQKFDLWNLHIHLAAKHLCQSCRCITGTDIAQFF